MAADAAIATETKYINETLAGGKWRHMMSPEIGSGQWPSMRSTPPKISLADFQTTPVGPDKPNSPETFGPAPTNFANSSAFFGEFLGKVSIEAENFQRKTDRNGFGWRVIRGLGKTGDSVSVPGIAHTFDKIKSDSPFMEFDIRIDGGDHTATFYLIPTQPLVPGNGLRFAFSIGDGEPQVVVADKDTEVSSRKWAQNVLDETTFVTTKFSLAAGSYKLRIFAVDTGVVLDKIVLASKEMPVSYIGPAETRFPLSKK